jgi:hypothetical protein
VENNTTLRYDFGRWTEGIDGQCRNTENDGRGNMKRKEMIKMRRDEMTRKRKRYEMKEVL